MIIKIKEESMKIYPGLENNSTKSYFVLNIDIKSDGSPHEFLIEDKNYGDTPVLISSNHCEIIKSDIPSGWLFYENQSGAYTLGPKEIAGNFWTRFYDNEPEALLTMKHVIQRTKDFHGIKD